MAHTKVTFLVPLLVLLSLSAPSISTQAVPQAVTCPAGYVLVPALAGYTSRNFCLAKYEMKNDGGTPKPQAAGAPWVDISRDQSLAACRALGPGYDLVSLNEWQTVARNVADTAVNWSSGMSYVGDLNTGNSDGSPGIALPADLDDNNACAGTGEVCSATIWNGQRRTHTLSNGSVVWDMAGNVWDLLRDTNHTTHGAEGFIATFNTGDTRQTLFGNDQFCSSASSPPHCGFGWGYMTTNAGAIRRGGDSDTVAGHVYGAGIFSTNLNFPVTAPQGIMGFRCSFQP